MNLFWLILGLALLAGAGDVLVRGAAGLARCLGISSLAIGLTVVAFGTSAPELAVNLLAAMRGSSSISFGNIMGSNMANIGVIVGVTALIRPVQIERQVVNRELPMMLLATVAAMVMGFDVALGQHASDSYDRADGLVLMLFFLVFVYYTISDLRRQRANNATAEPRGTRPDAHPRSIARHVAMVATGIVGLVVGAEITVDGAIGVARGLGVSEVVIGLTLVAVGTSLPELAASLMAAVRGQIDLAVGNVIGSNIFNLLLVAGLTSSIRAIEVPAGGHLDLLIVTALSFLLLLVSVSNSRVIIRIEAATLLLVYLAYIAFRSVVAFAA
ncbi:MAG: calcium/sodium antiporter [Deltaproteobacteria bacterium]|nr:MAG: calcium/sodium antiporter [Deltaproteobacteria bacterium]